MCLYQATLFHGPPFSLNEQVPELRAIVTELLISVQSSWWIGGQELRVTHKDTKGTPCDRSAPSPILRGEGVRGCCAVT